MIKYMSIEEHVDADFTRARQRAFLHRMKARLRSAPSSTSPLSFVEVRNHAMFANPCKPRNALDIARSEQGSGPGPHVGSPLSAYLSRIRG